MVTLYSKKNLRDGQLHGHADDSLLQGAVAVDITHAERQFWRGGVCHVPVVSADRRTVLRCATPSKETALC
jgi:hypothetical protein